MKTNLARSLMITSVAVGSLLSAGSVASAAPVTTTATVAAIPSCVILTQGDTTTDPIRSYANVRSFCAGTYRMRFIWAWTTDGGCFTLAPGDYHGESKPGRGPYVSELRPC
ncbi:hypothetical protein ACQPZF_29240 [Actinosynnema sp. CS-041913]|uniref:hypothetical protein n=1 Tax=Actinosynnema sp. CS-041913 TaxID=3239917 RepID=UPI003D89C753